MKRKSYIVDVIIFGADNMQRTFDPLWENK